MELQLLVSCPSKGRDKTMLGGLFLVDFETASITKLLDANARGFTRYDEGFLVAGETNIMFLDQDFNLVDTKDTGYGDLHGLKLIDNNRFAVVETSHNSVGIYEIDTFQRVDEIRFSVEDKDVNHLNDILIEGDLIYISMFSEKENWRNTDQCKDGCVIVYNLKEKRIEKKLFENVQMPHSVMHMDGELVLCESLAMNVRREDEIIAQYQGFTRGMDYNGRFLFVGQSEMRHIDRFLKHAKNVSVDCGIHVMDTKTRCGRFIPFPAREIYEISIINDKRIINSSIVEPGKMEAYRHLVFAGDWQDAEVGHRWTANYSAGIYIKKPEDANFLAVDLMSAYPGEMHAEILISGEKCADVNFIEAGNISVDIQIREVDPQVLEVEFRVEKLWRPSLVIGGEDNRDLGIAVRKVEALRR